MCNGKRRRDDDWCGSKETEHQSKAVRSLPVVRVPKRCLITTQTTSRLAALFCRHMAGTDHPSFVSLATGHTCLDSMHVRSWRWMPLHASSRAAAHTIARAKFQIRQIAFWASRLRKDTTDAYNHQVITPESGIPSPQSDATSDCGWNERQIGIRVVLFLPASLCVSWFLLHCYLPHHWSTREILHPALLEPQLTATVTSTECIPSCFYSPFSPACLPLELFQ